MANSVGTLKQVVEITMPGVILAPGFPIAIRLTLDTDGKRSNPRWRRTDIEKWVTEHLSQRRLRGGRPRQQTLM